MRDDATLAEYDRKLSIRRFPAGRAIQAVRPMEAPARRFGYADLLNLIAVAIAAAMRYIEFKARRSAQNLARGGGMTRSYDAKVDSNFAQMHGVLAREAKDYAAERSGKLAQSMLDACFPKGLAPVTSVPYEEQVAVNEYLVAVMRRDHAAAIDELGLADPGESTPAAPNERPRPAALLLLDLPPGCLALRAAQRAVAPSGRGLGPLRRRALPATASRSARDGDFPRSLLEV